MNLKPESSDHERKGQPMTASSTRSTEVGGTSGWLAARRFLNDNRASLTDLAIGLYPDHLRVGRSTLLSSESWLPPAPLPIEEVRLEWEDEPQQPAVLGVEAATTHLRPAHAGGRHACYADALGAIARPRIFEDRPAYRLLDAAYGATGARMRFGMGRYFDSINTCEAVGHELADAVRQHGSRALERLPFRKLVGDPLSPAHRPMLPAITTLTLRQDGPATSFLLHWRDPTRVASGGGLYQVTPVGVFQPAGVSVDRSTSDFDLWRCMAREFSEELLGETEHVDVDYSTWPFYEALTRARASRHCRAYVLGIGVDPLTLVTDILTVVVFDAGTFDEVFRGLVAQNAEGETTAGVEFTAETVDRLVCSEPMQPAGKAVLELSWRHRKAVLAT